MFALLKELVLIQSGSDNKRGVDKVAQRLESAVRDLPMTLEVVEQQMAGNHLLLRSKACAAAESQALMVGHMDTVFPKDTDFNWYREDEYHAYGPGVADMKGGLVAGVFALKALGRVGLLDRLPLTCVFNSDEEIGSRTSIELIQSEASQSAFAFVLEAGGLSGGIVTGRKGNLIIELMVEGKAGHAAFAGPDKASAILEMAHKIIAFEALNDFGRGITVNVGKIEGGIGANTVSDLASAQIDLRYTGPQDLKDIEKKVFGITESTQTPGTMSRMDVLSGRPPMEKSAAARRLFEIVKKVAEQSGDTVTDEFRHGVSDANFIADLGIPVLDGLGPVGGNDHSRNEFMVKESLLKRTTLLANALPACWEAYGPHRND